MFICRKQLSCPITVYIGNVVLLKASFYTCLIFTHPFLLSNLEKVNCFDIQTLFINCCSVECLLLYLSHFHPTTFILAIYSSSPAGEQCWVWHVVLTIMYRHITLVLRKASIKKAQTLTESVLMSNIAGTWDPAKKIKRIYTLITEEHITRALKWSSSSSPWDDWLGLH